MNYWMNFVGFLLFIAIIGMGFGFGIVVAHYAAAGLKKLVNWIYNKLVK